MVVTTKVLEIVWPEAMGPTSDQLWVWPAKKLVSHYNQKNWSVPIDKTPYMIMMDVDFRQRGLQEVWLFETALYKRYGSPMIGTLAFYSIP